VPRTNPERSFAVAVRHMFRHLNDGVALSRNPLTREYFGQHDNKRHRIHSVSTAEIKKDILDIAQHCSVEDMATGRVESARRFPEIIAGLCEGRSAVTVASSLGISLPQYYRDRRAICLRVGRVLWASNRRLKPMRTAICDMLLFEQRRLAALVNQGFAKKAITEGERCAMVSPSPSDKAGFLLQVSDACLEFGDADSASKALRYSALFLGEAEQAQLDCQSLQARFKLAEFRLAMVDGRFSDGSTLVRRLVDDVPRLEMSCTSNSELVMDVLLDYSRVCILSGRSGGARDAINQVSLLQHGNHEVSSQKRVELAVMKANLAESSSSSHNEVIDLFSLALNLAQAAGSATGMVWATTGIAKQLTILGEYNKGEEMARTALYVARSMEGYAGVTFAVEVMVPVMLRTGLWPFVSEILRELGNIPLSPYFCMRRDTFRGQLLSREGKYSEAVNALRSAEGASQALNNRWMRTAIMPELAVALQGCRRIKEAREAARTSVDLTTLGVPPLVKRFTYKTAGKILGDRSLLRRAADLDADFASKVLAGREASAAGSKR
jgi:tetratricopeptide (TPR) repeat protein